MLCLVYVFGALVEFAAINFHESLEARRREKRNTTLKSIDVERGSDAGCKGQKEGSDPKTKYLTRQVSSLREKIKAITDQDVNVQKIDSRSRVLFPVTFFVINLIFWIYFIVDSTSE